MHKLKITTLSVEHILAIKSLIAIILFSLLLLKNWVFLAILYIMSVNGNFRRRKKKIIL